MDDEECVKCFGVLVIAFLAILFWPIALLLGGIYIFYKICIETDDEDYYIEHNVGRFGDDGIHIEESDFQEHEPPQPSQIKRSDLALKDDAIFIAGKSGCVLDLEQMGYIGKNQFDFSHRGIEKKIQHIRNLLARNKRRIDAKWKEREAPVLLGALGELYTLQALAELRGPFVILNNRQLHFDPPFRNRDEGEIDYVVTSQIDHVVIGPSGVYAIESKNWGAGRTNQGSFTPLKQARRCGKALWYFLVDEVNSEASNVKSIISVSGSASLQGDTWVQVLPANQVGRYIIGRKTRLSLRDIEEVAKILR